MIQKYGFSFLKPLYSVILYFCVRSFVKNLIFIPKQKLKVSKLQPKREKSHKTTKKDHLFGVKRRLNVRMWSYLVVLYNFSCCRWIFVILHYWFWLSFNFCKNLRMQKYKNTPYSSLLERFFTSNIVKKTVVLEWVINLNRQPDYLICIKIGCRPVKSIGNILRIYEIAFLNLDHATCDGKI